MAIDQSAVNQAVLSTASKVSDLLFAGTPPPTFPFPSTALDGYDVGAARFVKVRSSLAVSNVSALLALWSYQPTPGGGMTWAVIDVFPANVAPSERRVYIGTATRVLVTAYLVAGRNEAIADPIVNIYAERPSGA